jgi:hypothetical protein
MNDKTAFVASAILAISLSVWQVFAQPEGLKTLVVVQLCTIILLSVAMFYFYFTKRSLSAKVGLIKMYDHRRSAADEEYKFMRSANRTLTLVGIMHRSLWNYSEDLEEVLLNAARRNVEIKFYLSSPDGEALRRRAEDEGDRSDDWPQQTRLQISRFKHLKEKYPTLQLSVFTYTEYPVWHIILRDGNRALVGWYPLGRTGYDAPLCEMTLDAPSSFCVPIERWLRSLEGNATQVL